MRSPNEHIEGTSACISSVQSVRLLASQSNFEAGSGNVLGCSVVEQLGCVLTDTVRLIRNHTHDVLEDHIVSINTEGWLIQRTFFETPRISSRPMSRWDSLARFRRNVHHRVRGIFHKMSVSISLVVKTGVATHIRPPLTSSPCSIQDFVWPRR